MDADALASACDFLQQYGIEPDKLALVVAGLCLLSGAKLSCRLSMMALRGAVACTSSTYKWLTQTPEPGAVEREAVTALTSGEAVWKDGDGGSGVLMAGRVYAFLEGGKIHVELLDGEGTDITHRLSAKSRLAVTAAVRDALRRHQELERQLEDERVLSVLTANGKPEKRLPLPQPEVLPEPEKVARSPKQVSADIEKLKAEMRRVNKGVDWNRQTLSGPKMMQ